MHADVIATRAPKTATGGSRLRLLALLRAWRERRRTRRALERLPDHLLRDIGLDPLTARRESQKPFWRV